MTWKQYQELYILTEKAERHAVQVGETEIARELDDVMIHVYEKALCAFPKMRLR